MSESESSMELDYTLRALRGFTSCFVVRAAIHTGVLERLAVRTNVAEALQHLGAGQVVKDALADYLEHEGLITRFDDGSGALTDVGHRALQQRGWYELFVGGYEPVLAALPALLARGVGGEQRDLQAVALGSGQIGVFDAAPLVRRLIGASGRVEGCVLDVGCGNAQLLCEALRFWPKLTGIAIDPSDDAVRTAAMTVHSYGMQSRVRVGAGDPFASETRPTPTLILAAFVLQEMLGQQGESELVESLRGLSTRFPDALWIVVEVDNNTKAPCMNTLHGLGYYNPYFLLHPLTSQKLLARAEWEKLFRRAGLSILTTMTTDPAVDPTGLELGFLLRTSR